MKTLSQDRPSTTKKIKEKIIEQTITPTPYRFPEPSPDVRFSGTRSRRLGLMRLAVYVLLAAIAGWGSTAFSGPSTLSGGSLWDDHEGSRYTNRKAMRVGDLITVMVTETSQGSNRSALRSRKEHNFDVKGGPGAGPFDFISLFELESNMRNEIDGDGQISLQGQLFTTLTVEVKEIRPNDQLVIEGSRLIQLNGDENRFTLHGVARTEDIGSDNTILSTKLAEVRISYDGKGVTKDAARRGVFQRLLGWIF